MRSTTPGQRRDIPPRPKISSLENFPTERHGQSFTMGNEKPAVENVDNINSNMAQTSSLDAKRDPEKYNRNTKTQPEWLTDS